MTLLDRARQIITGARAYRFEGERENHADLLRERRVSLSMMANVDPQNPDQLRMASEIEHDAEARLTVLLGKPQLTMEEKRERDAIQAAIQARRAGFGSAPVLVTKESKWAPARFLGPWMASPVATILLSPWTWLAAVSAFCLLQMGLKERVENQRDEARAEVSRLQSSRDAYAGALAQERAARANDVAQVLEDTAETVEQMRRAEARRRAREARERSRNEDLANGSVNFTERLRELSRTDAGLPAVTAPAPSGDPASAVSTGPGSNANNGANP